MAISGVDPKCYILALFVRDDGVRFLLGDDPFEFKDKQLHFQPNTVANDVVEVQGNDGYLLAGQVRRPGTQMFDGYVCNGTNSKEEVEVKRRAFLQFFRRSHFYKVIYVFPNGTAIQRKQGFLVDDPTVQELYQQYPAYHVALNFEDVNYYTYEEDDQGHEIYAKEAIIKLAGGGATGGLIWDNYGVVWENPWSDIVTVSGVDFQVDNLLPVRVPIDDAQLKGETYQQTYSGKNLVPFTTQSTTINALGVYCQHGSLYLNGTTNAAIGSNNVAWKNNFSFTLPAGTYTLSGDTNRARSIRKASDNSTIIGLAINEPSGTFTLNEETEVYFGLYISSGVSFSDYKFDVQLEAASTSTPYEPYVGGIPSPNPDYPQDIHNVTGEQAVIISDNGEQSKSYPISLGSIELCKIGDYQDYIYKSGDDWYVHKMCDKVTFNGTENWQKNDANVVFTLADAIDYMRDGTAPVSDNFLGQSGVTSFARMEDNKIGLLQSSTNNRTIIKYTAITSASALKTWLSTHNTIVYYPLSTAIDTQITDATLVGQLEALDAMRLFIGENNILVSASSPNLPATLQFDYYTQYLEPHGAEWEEGGTKGATIVNVDAIDNTYPVWELTGPAINPTLSVLTTNTTLTYNGTITASQKLVIDMFNKTATLNGTSVIGNVTGDFVYMAPGTNRVAYTAGNADAPDSKISWQEVVG